MFEKSSTNDKLIAEYISDLPDIQAKTLTYDRSNYMTDYLWKRRRQSEVYATKCFDAKSGRKYLGVLRHDRLGASKLSQWNLSSYHFRLIKSFTGQQVIAFYLDKHQAIKFTPHFFARYKERFSKICDWKTKLTIDAANHPIDIISVFMMRNSTMTWIETTAIAQSKTHIFGPVNDGVALLEWDSSKDILQANTFITMEMLGKKQRQMVEYAKTYNSMTDKEKSNYQPPIFVTNG